jgi:uncharacterized protein YjbI with pentapeptide repeats
MWRIKGSTIAMSTLQNAQLSFEGECVMKLCDLSGSQVTGDLTRATMFGCVLHDTDFRNTNIEGVDLPGSHYTELTRWPTGFDPEDAGATIPSPKIRALLGIPAIEG